MRRRSTSDRRVVRNQSVAVGEDFRMVMVGTVLVLAVVSPNVAFRSGAALCAAAWLASAAAGFRLQAADWLALAYAGLAGISLLWTPTLEASSNSFFNAVACAMIFIAVRSTTNRPRDYAFLAGAMILGSVLSIGLTLLSGGQVRWRYQLQAQRYGVEGLNYNYTAYALALTAAVLLGLLAAAPRNGHLRRLSLAGLFLLMYLGILMNGTRGALISIFVLTGWWLFSRVGSASAYWTLVIVFVISQLAMLTGWMDRVLSSLVPSGSRDTGDLNGRLSMWPVARRVFWESPLAGHGIGSFPGRPDNVLGLAAHAAVLDIGTGVGALGIILFFGALLSGFNRELYRMASSNSYVARGSVMAASLPILLSGFVTEAPVLWMTFALVSRSEVYFSSFASCGRLGASCNLRQVGPP